MFEKLHKYIGKSVEALVNRSDAPHVFRLHKKASGWAGGCEPRASPRLRRLAATSLGRRPAADGGLRLPRAARAPSLRSECTTCARRS